LDLIVLDDLERLRVVGMDGKYLWTSPEKFGGTTNFYDTKKKSDMVYYRGGLPADWRVYIPGRIVTKDLEGHGLHEVIVNKNSSSGTRLLDKVRNFSKGEVYGLAWDENALATNWKTREINGYISDFQVKDADNDGEEELVLAVVLPPEEGVEGVFSKKVRSNILFFKLF
jgi:hypothetical protein